MKTNVRRVGAHYYEVTVATDAFNEVSYDGSEATMKTGLMSDADLRELTKDLREAADAIEEYAK